DDLKPFLADKDLGKRDVLDLLQLTGQLIRIRAFAEALPVCRDAQRREPGNSCMTCHLGICVDAVMGRHGDPAQWPFAAVAPAPRHVPMWEKLAVGLRRAHEPTAVLDVARRMVTFAPTFAEAHAVLGDALLVDTGEADGAIGEFRKAAEIDSANFTAVLGL